MIKERVGEIDRLSKKFFFVVTSSEIKFVNERNEEVKPTYNDLRRDFQEYVECLTTFHPVPEDNLFTKLKKEYHTAEADQNNGGGGGGGVRLGIDEFMHLIIDELQLLYPEREFIYCAIPHRGFKESYFVQDTDHVPIFSLAGYDLIEDLYVLPCNVCDFKPIEALERIDTEYVKDALKQVLTYPFVAIKEENILIIFIYDGYNYRAHHMYDDTASWRDQRLHFDNLRYDLRQHLCYRLKLEKEINDVFHGIEYDWKVGRLWTSERCDPDIDFKLGRPYYPKVEEAIIYGRKEIDNTMEELKKLYPNKTFYYIVLPSIICDCDYLIL
jgi:hypothetical protein